MPLPRRPASTDYPRRCAGKWHDGYCVEQTETLVVLGYARIRGQFHEMPFDGDSASDWIRLPL